MSKISNPISIEIISEDAAKDQLDLAVAAWLNWIRNRRSRSEQTWEGYGRALREFRSFLWRQGRDLDPYAGLPDAPTEAERRAAINVFADLIQQHLTTTLRGKQRVATSYNRDWSVLRSFYDFAIRKDFLLCSNPVVKVDRVSTQFYRASRSLDLEHVVYAMNHPTHPTSKCY